MDQNTTEAVGRRFYEAYCAHADWKNYQGNPCPQWPDLTEAVRSHWRAVAEDAEKLYAAGAST